MTVSPSWAKIVGPGDFPLIYTMHTMECKEKQSVDFYSYSYLPFVMPNSGLSNWNIYEKCEQTQSQQLEQHTSVLLNAPMGA